MSSVNNTPEKVRFLVKLGNFVQKYRKIFLYSLVACIVILAAVTIFVQVRESIVRKSTLLVETEQAAFETWKNAEADKKEELEKGLRENLQKIIDSYSGTYAAQRALFIRGSLEATKENWDAAAADFTKLADGFPGSYLSNVALYNSAVCYENLGKNDEAMAAYSRIAAKEKDSAPQIPQALFQLGRLSEKKGDPKAASEHYTKLLNDYPEAYWSSLGNNRLIALTAKGDITR